MIIQSSNEAQKFMYLPTLKLERVKKEWRKLENIFLDLHILPIIFKDAFAQTYLQLPLWQWGAGNVYLLVLSSWMVNIAENPIAVMGL